MDLFKVGILLILISLIIYQNMMISISKRIIKMQDNIIGGLNRNMEASIELQNEMFEMITKSRIVNQATYENPPKED